MPQGIAPGSAGYLLSLEETTQFTYQTPTEVVWAQSIGNADAVEAIRRSYFNGYPVAETGLATGKVSSSGNLGWDLMPNAGVPWLKRSLGKAALQAPRSTNADTVKAATPVTTANGVSTVVLTNTGAAIYQVGDWFLLNSATPEVRMIKSWVQGSGTLTCDAFVLGTNATAAAATPVVLAKPDVTVTSSVSTALDMSSMLISTGMAYKPGDLLVFGGPTGGYEVRPVWSYNSATGALVVPALKTYASAAAGLRVTMPYQHVFTIKNASDSGYMDLPTASVAICIGGQFDQRYPGTYAMSFEITGGAQTAAVAAGLVPTQDPVFSATPTAFNPTAVEDGDQSDFFTINQGFVVTPLDYNASGVLGTNAPAINRGVSGFKLTIANGSIEKKHWNLSHHVEASPGNRKISGAYTYTNKYKRLVELQDFILNDAGPETPLTYFFANLTGPLGTPQAMNFYIPNAKFMDAPGVLNTGDIHTITASWEADRPTGGDVIQVNVLNQRTTLY